MSTAYFQLSSGTVVQTESPSIWENDPKAKRLTRAAGKQALHDESLAALRGMLQPGDTVHCVLRSVASSGMSRTIDFFKVEDGDLRYLSGYIANVLDYNRTKDGALKVSGCGMDMGFAVVYELGRTLWPKGDGVTVTGRNGEKSPETDGGYFLKHRWI